MPWSGLFVNEFPGCRRRETLPAILQLSEDLFAGGFRVRLDPRIPLGMESAGTQVPTLMCAVSRARMPGQRGDAAVWLTTDDALRLAGNARGQGDLDVARGRGR
jgi:hypothetical protein